MPRIAGVNIPENKRIEIALTYIYGIGPSLSRKILNESSINFNIKASEIDSVKLNELRELIEKKYKIEGELKRAVMMDIKRLKDIGVWRGLRHLKRLPVRGQRTKTNNRTVRGNNRNTVGSGRKGAPAPK